MQNPKKMGRPKEQGLTLKEWRKLTSAKAQIEKKKQAGWIPIYGKDPRKVANWIDPEAEASLEEDDI